MAKAKSEDGSMNKRQIVQAAFEAIGDVGPGELQAYITKTHGTELPINIISSYKSQIKKKLGLGRKNKKRGRGPAKATASKVSSSSSDTVNIGELEAVSQLVQKMGIEKVISLANIVRSFSK